MPEKKAAKAPAWADLSLTCPRCRAQVRYPEPPPLSVEERSYAGKLYQKGGRFHIWTCPLCGERVELYREGPDGR